jgi:hypothetical protein
LPRFRAAHTQVLGISVDSIFCHANWGSSLGGVSFPLLADFHPKGATAQAYGCYLDGAGNTDRATVLIDANGVVRHASAVTPAGKRQITELAAHAETVDAEHGTGLADLPTPEGIGNVQALYVKSGCGHSAKVMLARDNLHLAAQIPLCNVTDDSAALSALTTLAGKDQAPCLVLDGKPMYEADDIVNLLTSKCSNL